MKKISLLILLIIVFALNSQAQAKKIKFFYYPSSNVYYNTGSNKYVYNHNGKWTTANTLPAKANVTNAARMVVYNNTPQVWENNREHLVRAKLMNLKKSPVRPVKAKGRNNKF